MSHDFDPDFGTALDAAAAIRAKKISSLELTQHTLRRIDAFQPALNAYVYLLRDEALAAAARADDAIARHAATGALHGVPINVKEAFGVEGQPCTWGMPPLKAAKAPAHAVAVRRLLDEAEVVGRLTAALVESFADWVVVDLPARAAAAGRRVGRHRDPTKQPLVDAICAHPARLAAWDRVLRDGGRKHTPLVIGEQTNDGAYGRAVAEPDARSAVVVSLRTGRRGLGACARTREAGFAAHVAKPVDVAHLLAVVARECRAARC